MNRIIDLVLVLIVLFFVWRGYKDGLILGVLGIVAIIVSFAVANIVANTYSGEFTAMLQPFASGIVDKAISDALPESEDGAALAPDALGDVYTITFTALRKVGLSEKAASQIAEKASGQVGYATAKLSDRVTEYLCEKLAFIIVFAVSFILLAIVFATIGNIINLAFSLPGLESVNRIAGAAFGFSKGVLILLFIACLFRYLGILISEETLEKTILLKWLINSNILANLIGV